MVVNIKDQKFDRFKELSSNLRPVLIDQYHKQKGMSSGETSLLQDPGHNKHIKTDESPQSRNINFQTSGAKTHDSATSKGTE
mmetsp:Transcript_8028/g.9223  ORF Transcript_8028/g.9223 Transcript_8028/m.9223 type:complete len:82 (-) Transcript_8028:781-1026(-)